MKAILKFCIISYLLVSVFFGLTVGSFIGAVTHDTSPFQVKSIALATGHALIHGSGVVLTYQLIKSRI